MGHYTCGIYLGYFPSYTPSLVIGFMNDIFNDVVNKSGRGPALANCINKWMIMCMWLYKR
jgi:hypothetical protein